MSQPKPISMRDPRGLTCPFGKADPLGYPKCVGLFKRDLYGLKEHIHKLHCSTDSARKDVAGLRSWDALFTHFFPGQKIPQADTNDAVTNWNEMIESWEQTGTFLHDLPPSKEQNISRFQVAWVCRLEAEMISACQSLDQEYFRAVFQTPADRNSYSLGRIGGVDIVIAQVAADYSDPLVEGILYLVSTFPALRSLVLVGLGQAIGPEVEIGDVVIGADYGLVQYAWDETVQLLQKTGVTSYSSDPLEQGLERYGKADGSTKSEVYEKLTTLMRNGTEVIYISGTRMEFVSYVGQISWVDWSDRVSLTKELFDITHREDIICVDNQAAKLYGHLPCLPIWGVSENSLASDPNRQASTFLDLKAIVAAATTARNILLKLKLSDLQNETPLKECSALKPFFQNQLFPQADSTASPLVYRSVDWAKGKQALDADVISPTLEIQNPEIEDKISQTRVSNNEVTIVQNTTTNPRPMETTCENVDDTDQMTGESTEDKLSSMCDSDEETVYSETSSIFSDLEPRETCFREMASALADEIISVAADEELMEKVYSTLPYLLKAFSLRLGSVGSTQMHLDVMYLIHRNNGAIVELVEAAVIEKTTERRTQNKAAEQENSSDPTISSDGQLDLALSMTVVEKMHLWDDLLVATEPGTKVAETEIESHHQKAEMTVQQLGYEDAEAYQDDTSRVVKEIQNKMNLEKAIDPKFLQLNAYNDFIFKSVPYEWLIGALRRELLLTVVGTDAAGAIRAKILDFLRSSTRISRKRAAERYELLFTFEWEFFKFYDHQRYKDRLRDALQGAITITGSLVDAQALTCLEYLSQTWPVNGKHVLQLIQDACAVTYEPNTSKDREQVTGVLPDGTHLTIELSSNRQTLSVKVFGTKDSIAEVGEQLAWIKIALGSPRPQEAVITIYEPLVTGPYFHHYRYQSKSKKHIASINDLRLPAHCRIEFVARYYERTIKYAHQSRTVRYRAPIYPSSRVSMDIYQVFKGQCWHDMFRIPIVISGFPIPRRPLQGTGLEIPLHMATSLLQTDLVEEYRGNLFVKGFSSLLTAVEDKDDVMFWHLTVNPEGERVSYNDGPIDFNGSGMDRIDLKQRRHIVGWCPAANFHAGALNACYDIEPSNLAREYDSNLGPLGITISKGRLVSGTPVAIGNCDIPIAVSRIGNGAVSIVRWISSKQVVFWDEEDKRGWLVNGASALLHILRGSLYQDTNGQLKSICSFKWGSFNVEPRGIHTATSAVDILLNYANRQQEIYRDEDGCYKVHDRIRDLCRSLEKMFDSRSGIVDMSCGLRHKEEVVLRGWDFSDLAETREEIHPRSTTLRAIGTGWVELVKTLGAVVLFGRGFGEIIQPIDTFTCDPWSKLPSGENYLAATGYDIRQVLRMGSRQKTCSLPIRFSSDLMWHPSENIFGECGCSDADRRVLTQSIGHAQLLSLNSQSDSPPPQDTVIEITEGSAIVFGYGRNYIENGPIRIRSDIPTLRKQNLKSPSQESNDTFQDSGVGSSIAYGCEDYTIAILCALPKEMLAVRALFDINHDPAIMRVSHVDANHYAFGRMGQHNIVAVCLPYGRYGTNSAGHVVSDLKRSFQNMRFCFLVGIAGGVPSPEHDIRLGDVVVGCPRGIHGGVIQHDLGKVLKDHVERTGLLHSPPSFVLTAISNLESRPKSRTSSRDTELQAYINSISENNPEYRFPGVEHDNLRTCSTETDHMTCRRCDEQLRSVPKVHYGLIASGNQVIKDAETRDWLYKEHGVLCIEMEAAGVVNACPCLVVRGISDYADGDKNDRWQEYASASAAAYVKMLLSVVRSMEDDEEDLYARPLKRAGSQVDNPTVSKRQRTLGL